MSQDRSKNWKIKAQLENLIYENHKANRSRSFEKSHARAKSNTEHRIQPRVKSLPTHFFRMRAERFGSDPVSEIVSSLGVSRGGGLPRKKRLLDDRERSGARSHRDKRRMPVFGDRRRTRNDRSEKRRSSVQHPACASPPQAEEVRTETRFQSSRSPLGKARLRAHTGLPESRDSNGDPRRGWHHIVARADAPAYLADADALAMHNTDTIPRTSALSTERERERGGVPYAADSFLRDSRHRVCLLYRTQPSIYPTISAISATAQPIAGKLSTIYEHLTTRSMTERVGLG